MAASVEVLPGGSELECRITFENLTAADLGGLVAALDPIRVLAAIVPPGYDPAPRIASHLGGGKPLGLGSVTVAGLTLDPHSAASRYLGSEQAPPVELGALVDDFVASVLPAVKETWPDLAAVLAIGHVNPEVISYPPGAYWRRAALPEFLDGFTFWKRTAGRHLAHDPEPMVELPEPYEAD